MHYLDIINQWKIKTLKFIKLNLFKEKIQIIFIILKKSKIERDTKTIIKQRNKDLTEKNINDEILYYRKLFSDFLKKKMRNM